MANKRTVVLGASPKRERFSNKALRLLEEYGHSVIPVHPLHAEIEGIPVAKSLDDINEKVDTVTIYLIPETGAKMADSIKRLMPKRIIMNPGAESKELRGALSESGIEIVENCTLVMLRSGMF